MAEKIATEPGRRERRKEHFEDVLNMDGPAEAVEQIHSKDLGIKGELNAITNLFLFETIGIID